MGKRGTGSKKESNEKILKKRIIIWIKMQMMNKIRGTKNKSTPEKLP